MSSNVLATGRRTYLHESAALDFAIRACEALGLVFWALAPGTDIWATDYSQNSFRVHVGKSANGTRVVTGGGRRAYVAVGERRTVAQADQWSLFSVEGEAQDVAPVEETAETVAPVVDTAIEAPVVETAPATPVVIEVDSIEGHTATYSGTYAAGFTATCTCGWTMAGYALPTNARVAAREHVGDAAQETAPVAPAEHTVSVEKVRMSSGPGWRAVCTCGHASVAYFAEHAADTMAAAHAKETSPKSRDAIEATATAQGWTIEPSIVGDRQSTLTRVGVSIDLEYNVGGNVKRAGVYGQAFGSFGYSDRLAEVTPRDSGKRATVLAWLAAPVGATRAQSRDLMRDHVIGAPAADTADTAPASNDAAFATGDPVTVRGEGTDGADAHGNVTAYDGNVSVSLEDGSSVHVAASDVTPRVSDAAAAELAAHRASNDTAPRVMGITGTGVAIRDRESGKEYGFHAACWTSFADAIGPTARLIEVGPLFGDDWTCTQCLGASSNDAGDVGGVGDAGLVSTDHGASCSLHADNVVPAETEFAARVRTARTPKVPGIHVARCYRCGEHACETLRLPVSSLTNVCSEHADEARAVALRWDAASRYMHEEAPSIASNGRLAVRFTREATNRLDIPLAVIAETLIGADNTFGDIDTTLARRLDAFISSRGTAPSNPVVGKSPCFAPGTRVVTRSGSREFASGRTAVVIDGNDQDGCATVTVRWEDGRGMMIVGAADFARIEA